LNSFILIFNINDIHFDEQTEGILNLLERIFGEGFWNHTIVVFTFCDEEEKETWGKIQQKIETEFNSTLRAKYHFLKHDLQLFFTSSKSIETLKSVKEAISKMDKFDSPLNQEIRKLEIEKSEKEVDKYIDEVILKSIFDMTSCKLL
jgi:superoxide dismutase